MKLQQHLFVAHPAFWDSFLAMLHMCPDRKWSDKYIDEALDQDRIGSAKPDLPDSGVSILESRRIFMLHMSSLLMKETCQLSIENL